MLRETVDKPSVPPAIIEQAHVAVGLPPDHPTPDRCLLKVAYGRVVSFEDTSEAVVPLTGPGWIDPSSRPSTRRNSSSVARRDGLIRSGVGYSGWLP
jgi:hypothetical protein